MGIGSETEKKHENGPTARQDKGSQNAPARSRHQTRPKKYVKVISNSYIKKGFGKGIIAAAETVRNSVDSGKR